MQEKDYNSIYEKYFNEYIDEYINEMEGIYKSSLEEGDAEDIAHECCVTILKEKVIGLKIQNQPHSKLYTIFTKRNKLVQITNPNRLYTKYIIPACEELKIELNDDTIESYIKEFAISEAYKLLIERYVHLSIIYKMMFDLKDFTEFKTIKEANFPEGTEIFKKYQRELDSSSFVAEEKEVVEVKQEYKKVKPSVDDKKDVSRNSVKNFNLLEEYKKDFEIMYNDFIENNYIDCEKTTIKDFENVLFENWDTHKSFITFSCPPQEASLLLFKLMKFFSDLNFTNIGRSKVFKNKSGKIMTSTNYGQRVAPFNPKSGTLNLSTKQKTMFKRVESFIKLIEIDTFKSEKSS